MRDQIILIYSYLHGIWRYRWSALVISWFVVLIGWVVVYALPNQYTSKVVMHVDTSSVMTPLLKGLTVDTEVDAGLNIMTRLLLSRKNLEEVIRQTDLSLEIGNIGEMNRLIEGFAGSITLEVQGGGYQQGRYSPSNIYELSYQGASAELSYQVVSKLLNSLIDATLSSARTDTAEAQMFLDRQITEYEVRLTSAEQLLAKFKRANLGFMPDKTGGYYARLQREQSGVRELRSELRLARRRGEALRRQLKGEKPMLNNSYGISKSLKLRGYREELEKLLTQFTEQHPDVQNLRTLIIETVAQNEDVSIDNGVGSIEFNPVYQDLKGEIHKASVEVETLKIRLAEKVQSVTELEQSVDVFPEVEAKLAKLNRDYDITSERYLDLVERRESASLAQKVGQSGNNIKFRIIEPPRVPVKPSGPARFLLLTAVLLAAIIASLGWGFLRYRIEPTFIYSSQLRENIGLPMLGSVGLYLTDEHKKKRKMQLASFLLVFLLLLGAYGGVMAFSEPGRAIVLHLLTAWKIAA